MALDSDVDDGAVQVALVPAHDHAARAVVHLELHLAPPRERGQLLDRVPHELAEVHVVALHVQAAGLDPVEDEQVLDQPAQPGAVAVDDAEHRALPGRQLAGVTVLQQLEVAADGGQRRAQLVADRRQEVGLLPVQALQPLDVVPLVGLVLGLHEDAGGERGDLLDGVGLGAGSTGVARAPSARR